MAHTIANVLEYLLYLAEIKFIDNMITGVFPCGAVVNNPPANAGNTRDLGLIPQSGRFPGGGNGNTLQYSWQENPTDRGAWWATVHRVIRNWTTEDAGLNLNCNLSNSNSMN